MSKFSELFNNCKQVLIKEKSDGCLGKSISWLIVVGGLLIFIILAPYPQRIGVVNITGIVDEFIKTQAQNNLSPEELKRRVQVFGTDLEKVLHAIATKKHAILMPAEAVITGAKDYTKEVQQHLASVIQKFPQVKAQLPVIPQDGGQGTQPVIDKTLTQEMMPNLEQNNGQATK